MSKTEHDEQVLFFQYCSVAERMGFSNADSWLKGKKAVKGIAPVSSLKWIFAIPNGGSRGDNAKSRAIRGNQLRAEGVKKGVSDIFYPCPAHGYCGLFIEMKKEGLRPKRGGKGGVSEEQEEFLEYVQSSGYYAAVAYGAFEAIRILNAYITGELKA